MMETGSPPVMGEVNTGLGVLELEIVHATGTIELDPNSSIAAAAHETLSLGQPFVASVLTGGPGYLYRSSHLQMAFTRDELYRFLRRDLLPEEYFKLRNQFGLFFEPSESRNPRP